MLIEAVYGLENSHKCEIRFQVLDLVAWLELGLLRIAGWRLWKPRPHSLTPIAPQTSRDRPSGGDWATSSCLGKGQAGLQATADGCSWTWMGAQPTLSEGAHMNHQGRRNCMEEPAVYVEVSRRGDLTSPARRFAAGSYKSGTSLHCR